MITNLLLKFQEDFYPADGAAIVWNICLVLITTKGLYNYILIVPILPNFFKTRTLCHKQIIAYNKYAEIEHSDWMLQATWLILTN